MAYIDPNQQDQLQQQQGQQAGQQAASVPSSAQAPSSAGGVGGASSISYSPTAPTTGTQGTGFQNLNSYLDANQGNNLTQQVAGKVGSQVTQADQDLQSAQTGFKQAADQGTVQANPDNVQQVLANPTTADSQSTAQFQQQLNANFSGPQAAQDYAPFSQAQAEGQNAYGAAKALQDPNGGTTAILNRYFDNGGKYNAGEKALDSALLSGGDQAPLQAVEEQAQNLPARLDQSGQDLSNYANQAAATTAKARAAARSGLGIDDSGNLVQQGTETDKYGNPIYSGAIGGIESAATTAAADANAAAPAAYQKALTAIQTGNFTGLSPSDMTALNEIAPLVGKQLYGVDPTKYLTANAPNATAQTAMTPDQQAKLSALYNLAGIQNTFAPNASLAGTAKSPYTFDSGKTFQSDLSTAQTNNAAQASTIQQQIDQLHALQQTYVHNSNVQPSQIQATDDAIASLQQQLIATQAAAGDPYGAPALVHR